MKTPLSILLMVIVYWLAIYGISIVPHFSENYNLNLVWLTVIVPNVLRFIVGSIPRLAVDRLFFLSTSIIALIITFAVNTFWKDSKEAVEKYGSDRSKTLKLSALLMTAFAMGALITYYTGVDNSIYSNMGWESNNMFMASQSNL
jgi:mannose/fructose/N-acetylgalactosamine-specific phosphotransferase system component IID